jgi:hypothetical protein
VSDHPWLRARSISLGGGLQTPGYEYVLLDDAIEYAEAIARARLDDTERGRRVLADHYPTIRPDAMGRSDVNG